MEYKIKKCKFTTKLSQEVGKGFEEHTLEKVGVNRYEKPIAFKIQDKKALVGCIVFQLYWGSLEIKQLFVSKQYRERGIGTKLINYAIQYARSHACMFITLRTFSFQALEFYKKFGFEVEYVRTGYTNNVSLYILRRKLQ